MSIPARAAASVQKLGDFLAQFPTFAKLHPSYQVVRKHFNNLSEAWLEVGFETAPGSSGARRRKFVITQNIEDKLREIYSDPDRAKRKGKTLPGLRAYADEISIPKYYLIRHAVKLGLTFVKEPKWSPEEFALLDKLGHYVPFVIARKFAERGFQRTETSIRLMRKRRRVHKKSGYYSLNAVAKLLGVDTHVVSRWVDKEMLELIYKGTKRGSSKEQSAGDTRLVHTDGLYRFIINNPTRIDLRKVDQSWFLYLITEGEIPFAGSTRITKRTESGIDPDGEKHSTKKTRRDTQRQKENSQNGIRKDLSTKKKN